MFYVGDDVEVEDIASANGTELLRRTSMDEEATQANTRGVVVPHARTKLRPGDSLRIGAALLVLEWVPEGNRRGAGAGTTEQAFVLRDPEMRRLYDVALRAANSDISILILGETGVGKEVIAEAIHRNSLPRRTHF